MTTRDCLKWLWSASSGVRGRVVACAAAGAVYVVASLGFVWICKELIDAVTSTRGEYLAPLVAGMIVCMVVQIMMSALETRISAKGDVSLKNRLRFRLFSNLMESRWDGKETFHSGDTLNRVMEDVRVIAEAVTKSAPAVAVAGVQFLAAFAFLFMLQPGLAWTIPGIMLAVLLLSRTYVRRMRKLTKDIRTTESSMQSLMQESLQNRVVLHTLERTSHVTDTLSGQQNDLQDQVLDKTSYSIFARTVIQFGFSAGYAAAFLWGVFGIRSGAVTFGMMTAFLQLVGQIQRPIMNMSRQLPSLINSLTAAERLAEVEELPSEDKGEPVELGKSVGLRFADVTFSYKGSERVILNSLSHDFIPGSTTALLGETGVGKSTMMRLMLGLLHPEKGSVEIYNSWRTVAASPQTRCNIVYVPQGNTLMSGTIRENLLLGDPDATDGQLEDVLHLAAADFVKDLPDGLDTLCGEKGAGLSEGQAQRIAIARALLRKGGVLLLDEPTASLDTQTEEILLKRLSEHLAGRTLILVTHREAAAALCDETLYL